MLSCEEVASADPWTMSAWHGAPQFLLEGQEEIGSPHLSELLRKHRKLLAADFALSADGGQISETQVGGP